MEFINYFTKAKLDMNEHIIKQIFFYNLLFIKISTNRFQGHFDIIIR